MSRLTRLYSDCGQSPWIDNLRRSWLSDGTLDELIELGVRGLTSNPSILATAIGQDPEYREQIERLRGQTAESAYWELVLSDIASAAKRLLPLHQRSNGTDGFVSVEVDPRLSQDPDGTLRSAKELAERLSLPNVMIKIPATAACLPAITEAIASGISVNVTLVFGLNRYVEVMKAYQLGMRRLQVDSPEKLRTTHSVASIFVSRIDTLVDSLLDQLGAPSELRGRSAVALARLSYSKFLDVFSDDSWREIEAAGGTIQRPLWASTSTKNPAYSDLLYVNELIGPRTVNTMPDATLQSYLDHGTLAQTILEGSDLAAATIKSVEAAGVDFDAVFKQLEEEGLRSFESAHLNLLDQLAVEVGRGL